MLSAIIKRGSANTLKYRHPWIFSGAIKKINGSPVMGETLEIRSEDDEIIGYGSYSPVSKIAIRIWSFSDKEKLDESLIRQKVESAVNFRSSRMFSRNSNCVRLVFGEADGIPGLIVDKFAEYLVCQFLFTGTEFHKDIIVSILNELVPNKGIYERSDVDIREKEGLPLSVGVLSGSEPPDSIEINEGSIKYYIDIKKGHKTGFYLDQRINRLRVANYSNEMEVLDCFAYIGGFSIASLKGGAKRVTSVDSSSSALESLKRNVELNGLDLTKSETIEAKVAEQLRKYRDYGKQFDMIILDPPKFIYDRAHLEHASRAYKDINLLAMKLLRKNGILATFSCSQPMTEELFQKILSYASADSGRTVQILEKLSQSPDHPIALNFPESAYLKGLICRVI
ncbi:MAG TPA: 23S rRNA (cytosine(1962)-C(5))-methyltransferase RlmI [Lentisphaeria bacterium]|nr:MAG: 23S rRNA methyltransferase [Lentisphaerae bacterium GWF2_38_69]HBM15834.1 23S rRNA (cytosine(1962)-C(5))-methyltransferase RlmI [Lentisphaeria bacterium]